MPRSVKKATRFSKKTAITVAIALFVGLPVVILATRQTTNVKQFAAHFNDLNTSYEITHTNNADGTMGPPTSAGNYSNTFPALYLGKLNFQVTDPTQGKRTDNAYRNPLNGATSIPFPTHSYPTQAQGNDYQNNAPTHTMPTGEGKNQITPGSKDTHGGPQTVASLLVTITKVEVHLAHVGLPGTKNEDITPVPSPTHGKSQQAHAKNSNQGVNKWETLDTKNPTTVDLVQLAKSHDLSSLGITQLVNGRYTEIRLYISKASATLQDGTAVKLVIPGKQSIVRVVEPFVIDSGKTTSLTMAFDAQNSVIKAGNQYILKPVVANIIEKNK